MVEGTEPVKGQARLEFLEQMNLFVIPLDGKRRWYRYHHLFADVLNGRLEHNSEQSPSCIDAHLSGTSKTILSEAIQHALKAGDLDRAARLVEQHGCSLLMSGEVYTLLEWIEALRDHVKAVPGWLSKKPGRSPWPGDWSRLIRRFKRRNDWLFRMDRLPNSRRCWEL